MLAIRKKVKYLIASHVRYYKKTMPVILPSLLRNIPPEDIVLTVCEADGVENFGIETYCVPYNAYEYASLINIAEIGYCKSEYVFLLHDTMVCGENFFRLSLNFSRNHYATLAHVRGWTNMGMYHVGYLRSIKDRLVSYKGISKLAGIDIEGKICDREIWHYPNATSHNITRAKDIYGTGTQRIVDYYHAVDVTKYGANGPEHLEAKTFVNTP